MATGSATDQWFTTLIMEPVQSLLTQLLSFIPRLLGAIAILLVGGWIANAVEALIARLLKTVALDKLAEQIGVGNVLTRGGIKRKTSELIGAIIYWLVMLAVVMVAFNALELTVAAELFQRIVAFLPTTVRTTAINSGILQAHLLGQAVQTVVAVFTVVAALQQLDVQFVGEVFLIILAGVSFGAAIAFGLGCKDLAGRWVSDVVDQLQSRK